MATIKQSVIKRLILAIKIYTIYFKTLLTTNKKKKKAARNQRDGMKSKITKQKQLKWDQPRPVCH